MKEMERQTNSMFPIVCLCGSSRFKEAYQQAMLHETLQMKIVLTIGCVTSSDSELIEQGRLIEGMKERLDLLHLEKIKIADEVLFLNVCGYIGESTSRELLFAFGLDKQIHFWDEQNIPQLYFDLLRGKEKAYEF